MTEDAYNRAQVIRKELNILRGKLSMAQAAVSVTFDRPSVGPLVLHFEKEDDLMLLALARKFKADVTEELTARIAKFEDEFSKL